MKQLLVFALLLTLCGCNKIDTKLFTNYASSIKVLTLPITFDCEKDIPTVKSKNLDSLLLIKYKPEGLQIIGRIFPKDSILSIIYGIPTDDFLPVIYTYQIDGSPIDTFTLYIGGCQSDISGGGHSFSVINQNREIHLYDTTFTREVDANENIISIADSVFVSQKTFKMEENGHFTKLSDSTHFVGLK